MEISANEEYNAVASPMHLFEDGELLTKEELKRRRDEAIEKQVKKSRILVQFVVDLLLLKFNYFSFCH